MSAELVTRTKMQLEYWKYIQYIFYASIILLYWSLNLPISYMYRLKNLPFLIEMYKENKNFNKIKTLFSFKLEKQDNMYWTEKRQISSWLQASTMTPNLQLTMIYCQKPLTQTSAHPAYALSIRTAGGSGEGKNRPHGLLNMLKSTQHFPATH